MNTWHTNDDFWDTFATGMFARDRLKATPQEVDDLLALAQIKTDADLLDLPCGPGRHTLELARRGYRVTGVDRTKIYIDRAQRTAGAEDLSVSLLVGDMRSFSRPESFDGVLNLFTSFGYFEDQSEDQQVLRNFYDSLRPGGTLVMDMMAKEILARRFQPRDWRTMDDGRLWLEERRIRSGWDWIESDWICIDKTNRKKFTVGHRLYSGAELASHLLSAGFSEVQLYGSYKGTPYDQDAERLVAIAKRPR